MNDDEIWAAIDQQRLRIADWLESLSELEWRHASLCDGWSVCDVAAHLTLQQMGIGELVRVAIRHPGGINHMIRQSARRRSDMTPQRLIGEIRQMVGSHRHNIGVSCRETLIDILVHSQDISIPLGRPIVVEPEAAAEAATRVWSYTGGLKTWVFRRIRRDGLRFRATDIAWSAGAGRPVDGPILAILLVLTGRLAALPMLSGDGVVALEQSHR